MKSGEAADIDEPDGRCFLAQQWYRLVNGQTVGPLSTRELKDMAARGVLRPDELLYLDQQKTGYPAGKINGLSFGTDPSSVSTVAHHSSPVKPPVTASPPATAPAPPPFPPIDQIPEVDLELERSPHNAPVHPGNQNAAQLVNTPRTVKSPAEAMFATPTAYDSNPALTSTVPLPARAGIGIAGIVAAVLGALVLVIVAAVGTYLFMRQPGEMRPALADELKAERVKLQKDIDRLRDEAQKWEETKQDVEQKTKALERDKEQLELEIKKLTTMRETLDHWKGVDLVLMNSTQQAVGLKHHEGGFVVWDKQQGEVAEVVLSVSRNLHIARTVGHAQLAKDVFNQIEPGQPLSSDLNQRVRESVWKTHQFVSVRPDRTVNEIDLVAFRDLETSEVRIGFLHEKSEKGIRVEARGAPSELIPWKKIQSGSARHGRPDAILPMLGSVDFLEYSLLRIAQMVGTGDHASINPRLIIHSDIEISDDHLVHYRQIIDQYAAQSRLSDDYYYGYYHSDRRFFPWFAFFDSLRRTSMIERQHQLWEEMQRTDPHQQARHLAKYVEDEIQSRLGQWGIPTVSDKDLTKFETGPTPIAQAVRATSLHDATHLLYVTVKESRSTGEYHLSVRLFDETGKETWMNEGDRTLTPEPRLERYHVASGQLAVVTLHEKQKKISSETPIGALEEATQAIAPESPPLVTVGRSRGVKEQRSELVYLENSKESRVWLRTLFSEHVHDIPAGVVEKIVPVKNLNKDVPQDLVYRYALVRLLESLKLPAGRVESVANRAGEILGLAAGRGVVPGERCRVLRSIDGERSRSVLPTEAELSDVGADRSRVTFEESGFEDVYPENVLMQQGDLLVPKEWGVKTISVETLLVEEPVAEVAGNLKFDSFGEGGTGEKFHAATIKAGEKVARRMADALARAGVATSAPDFGSPDFPTTHRLHGSITLSPEMQFSTRFNPSSTPLFRVNLMLTEIESSGDVLVLTFDLHEGSL